MTRILLVLLPVMVVILFGASNESALAQTTVVKFSPQTTYVPPGSPPFTVDVAVQDVVTQSPCPITEAQGPCGLGAFLLKVSFDPTVIEFQQFDIGPFLTSTGRSLIFCPSEESDHDPAAGVLHYSCFTSGLSGGYAIPGPEGSGVLGTLTFDPLAEGTTDLVFEETVLADIDGVGVPHSTEDGQVIVAPLADVQASKTGPTSVSAPNNFDYTVGATNAGPSTAVNVTAVDTLPDEVTYVSSSGCSYDDPTREVTCGLGTLNNGESNNATITVSVDTSSLGKTIVNPVDVSSDTVDPVPANNHAEKSTTVLTANMSIQKSAPDQVDKLSTDDYEIVITNLGASGAGGVVVTDELPPEVTYVDSTTTDGSCDYSIGTHTVSCDVGELLVYDPATITITVTFPDADTSVCNEATVAWTQEAPPGLKTSNEVCTTVGTPDGDGDGCADVEEEGDDPTLGGQRDPLDPWDFYDVPLPVGEPGTGTKDKQIDGNDATAVLSKFGAVEGDPVPGAPLYDPAYDRSAPTASYPAEPYWDTGAPNGVQDGNDVVWNLWQFGHSCFAPP